MTESKTLMRHPCRMVFMLIVASGLCAAPGCKRAAEPAGENPTDVAVQVGNVTRATLRAFVDGYGIVESAPSRDSEPAGSAALAAPSAGRVVAVLVKEGERIRPGTLVVRLDDRVALAALDKASNAVAFAEEQMGRQNKLAEMHNTSAKTLQETRQQLAVARADLAAAKAQLALVQLTSPIDGIVARINVRPGQVVDLNTVVAEIVDPKRLIVTAGVPAGEAGRIREGQPVEVMPADESVAVTSGQILFVSPQVDTATGTVMVRISLSPDTDLSPGRFVHARIVTEEHANRLAVPLASVYTGPDGRSTLSIVEGNTATRKVVQAGLRDGGLVEVEADGLAEGMTVVTVGSYALPEKTKIHVVTSPQEVK